MMCRAFEKCAVLLPDLRGWRRSLAAYGLGVLAMFTLSPFFLFPLIIPAFAGLYLMIDAAPTRRRMFWDGWFWGWGYYMTGLYWFCIALLTDAEAFAWLIPFALFGLTGVIAIYSGLTCWLMAFVKKYTSRPLRLIAFALLWTLTEIARGHFFTGFPWNLPGYSFAFSLPSLQLASVFGAYGLTFCAVLLGVSPLFARYSKSGKTIAAGIWIMFALGLLWGIARIPPDPMPTLPGVKLRLVQANIAQPHKWDPALQRQGMEEHIRLMLSPGLDSVTHVIWPETAVPYVLQENSELAHTLGKAIPSGKLLITGTLRAEGPDYASMLIWNSLMAINHEGKLVGIYDKAHLVPFGEFQPFRAFVPKEWMTPVGDKDFSWGKASQILNWPDTPPMLPLICYEAIFPEMSQSHEGRPAWLLNVTNDAWFGMSTGPRQHFEMARMRSVEQGVPLVRSANTGISAIIDPYGRITASLPLGSQGILDAGLPRSLEKNTFYAKYRYDAPLWVALIVGAFYHSRRKSRLPHNFACKS